MAERTHSEYKELWPPLDGKVIVLAAHPDDEVLGALAWLLACSAEITIAFLTDGTPGPPWRPLQFTETSYRDLRRHEAHSVWQALRPNARLVFAPFRDQTLAFHLAEAADWLTAAFEHVRPTLLLAPAFEGGHPDHDAANLLASISAAESSPPVWEYALYTIRDNALRKQVFPAEPHWTLPLDDGVLAAQRTAFAGYRSQADTLASLAAPQQSLRPLPRHDYSCPALTGPAVYERWGFPVTAQQVADACRAFLSTRATACAS